MTGRPADGVPMRTIRQVNLLPDALKEGLYRRLIPSKLLCDLGIDPLLLTTCSGQPAVHFEATAGTAFFKIKVRQAPTDRDCALYVEMADTPFNQIEVLLLIVNDMRSERFDVDYDAGGDPTKFGLVRRNQGEEERALRAGLAPGQVRAGLRLLRPLISLMEDFVAALGHELWFLAPLAYHNAYQFERYGFGYVQGRPKMEWIDREFSPGGELHHALDGSSAFRRPELAGSVRGRSWAIHDGLLGEPWGGVRMYKKVGQDAGVRTVSAGVAY